MVLRQPTEEARQVMGAGKTRPTQALTHRSVEAMKAGNAPYRVPDQRCIGLAVRVAVNGGKSWDLAYRIKGSGKVRRTSLGRFPDFSLDDARARANTLTVAARGGRDLLAEEATVRAENASRQSVEQIIKRYVAKKVTGKLRTGKEIEARLLRSMATLLERPADTVRRRDLRPLFDEVSEQFPREAEKRRQTVGAMFRWAFSQDIVETDPTAGLTAYDAGAASDRVLDANEVRSVWEWASDGGLPPQPADIVKLQLCFGARCGEVAGMSRSEIDDTTWLWTLPAARSKNGKPRVTPVLGLARELLAARLKRYSKGPLFVGETGKVLTSAHIGHALGHRRKRMPVATFVTHDLRRTVATMLVEMGIPLETVAAVIGHEAGGRETRTLVRHYVRTDQIERKRVVLEAWDRRLSSIIAGNADSNVMQLTDRKKAAS